MNQLVSMGKKRLREMSRSRNTGFYDVRMSFVTVMPGRAILKSQWNKWDEVEKLVET